jgi:RND family efflux transporter MFP subunit
VADSGISIAGFAVKPLLQKGEISQVQFDVVQGALQAADADRAAVRLALLEAGTRREDIAEGKAKLANAQADLTAARLAIDFCRMTSPINGVVMQLTGRRGMSVDRNAEVATVVDESTLFVRFRVPNTSLFKVVPGATVHVQLTALPDQSFDGSVTRLGSQADNATGDAEAFATVANDAGVFRPGLGCRVTVDLPDVPDALVIPAVALADRAGTPVVTVVKGNKAREFEIKIGLKSHGRVQVIQGLSRGDVVVTENGYGLPDDCPVKIIND